MALTPEQIAAFNGQGNLTPDQSAATLGHSNGAITGLLGNPGAFAVGAAKGLGQDAVDLTSLAGNVGQAVYNQTGGRVVNAAEGKGFTSPGTPYQGNPILQSANTAVQPSNPAESAGKTTEQISELALPFMGVVGKTVEEAPTLARALSKASLRLSPTQIRDYKGAINTVSDYLVQHGITGNPEARYEKISNVYDSMEKKISTFLRTNNTARGVFASKSELLAGIDKIGVDLTKGASRDIQAESTQLQGAKDTINRLFKQEKIPIARLNDFKRSTMKNAFNKAGTKVSDQVEFALGDIAKGMVEKATTGLQVEGKDIGEFNKEYGTVITARKILESALGKPEIGNIESRAMRIMGMIAGGALGGGGITSETGLGVGLGYEVGAHLAPELLGTAAKTKAAAGVTKLGEMIPKDVAGLMKKAGQLKGVELGGDVTNQSSNDTLPNNP